MRKQYDEIYNSMVNGQRKQAIDQAEEMGLDEVPEFLDYLTNDLDRPEMAIDFAKSYFRIKAR
jgi:hypothetical protein